jgi:hypothetical protein
MQIKAEKVFDPLEIIAKLIDTQDERADANFLKECGFTDPWKHYE